ncbi:MAG: IclR family transcriptional regulator [Alphaproteobacteria bacterium]
MRELRGSSPLRRVAAILDELAVSQSGLSLSDISSRLGLPMPTAHRMLKSLCEIGYTTGGGGRARYRLGSRLLTLFQMTLSLNALRSLAAPILQPLADRFDATIFMTRLVQGEIQLAGTVVPSRSSRSVVNPGREFPLNATASAKAIMAFQEPEAIERALDEEHRQYRPRTVTDPRKLRSRLAEVRRKGYDINDDEYDAGVYSAACPIRIGDAGVIYAVGLVAFRERFLQEFTPAEMIAALKRAAERLARALQG